MPEVLEWPPAEKPGDDVEFSFTVEVDETTKKLFRKFTCDDADCGERARYTLIVDIAPEGPLAIERHIYLCKPHMALAVRCDEEDLPAPQI